MIINSLWSATEKREQLVIDKAVLKKKLQELNRYLKELEGYKDITLYLKTEN